MQKPTPNNPPVAKKQPHTSTYHGIENEDPYNWLRADNWQEVMAEPDKLDPEIRAYLEAENEYATGILESTTEIQETLFKELKGRIKQDDSTVPERDGKWHYYISYVENGEHPLYCRFDDNKDNPEVLVDGNKLSEGTTYFQFGGISHSPDHEFLAWSSDERGSEDYTIYLKNLKTGDVLDASIQKTTGNLCWSADSKALYYVRRDDNHRPAYVHRYLLNSEKPDDELIYQEQDPGFFVNIGTTQSRRFVTINASGHETSEWHLIDANDQSAQPITVLPREKGHEYSLDERGDKLYILTNSNNSEDFRITKTSISDTSQSNWEEFTPHKAGRLILSISLLSDYLVRLERENGLPRIVIHEFESGNEHAIEFDEEAYALALSTGMEFKTDNLRFTYSSMTTPAQVFDYNMKDRSRDLRKTQEIPSGHTKENYITKRVFAKAHDGAEIPVTLLYHKDTELNGSAPLYLYGYGSYGISIPAGFYANHLSLVERGFIYAIAHIRGGKEKGYHWYSDGKMENKSNTFKDFISVAEFLIENNFTSKSNIVAHGGSAGGMLMGAVANMAPDLFSGIIAEVPFVDVLNTMLDDTLPLTPPEWPEWGNPIESEVAYKRIKSYSPYDNVEPQDYPSMLVIAGLSDPRVTYWEPAKWVARLRDIKTNDKPLLLKTNMEAGHGGASGRFDHLKEVAFTQSFALKVANLIG